MIVVADTGPLNYLIRLDLVHILELLYGHLLVPAGVIQEMTSPGAPEQVSQWAKNPPGWVETVDVVTDGGDFPIELGLGERQAIYLALNRHADLILVDDLKARREASLLGFPVAGTLTVLVESAFRGQCDLSICIGALRHIGFRMSAELEATAKEQLRLRRHLTP